MEKKMTKREMYNLIKELNADNKEIVEFCDHEIELLDKKKASGKGKVNETMSANVELVYNVLAEIGKSTPTELIAKGETTLKPIANDMGIITTQKVSAYLNKLCDMGRVVKTIDKKKSYFSVVEN